MADNPVAWFANSGTIYLSVSGLAGGSATVGAIRNITIEPTFEEVPLYGIESVKRLDVAKHSMKVKVKAKYAMWDADADFIGWSWLNGAATNAATTSVNDGVNNRSTVATFNIAMKIINATRNATCWATAVGVYFTSLPFELVENTWVTRDIEGEAEDFTMAYYVGTE